MYRATETTRLPKARPQSFLWRFDSNVSCHLVRKENTSNRDYILAYLQEQDTSGDANKKKAARNQVGQNERELE